MFRGKYLAGILASYIAILVIAFYAPISLGVHIGIMAALLFLIGVSIFVKNRRVSFEKRRVLIFLLAAILLTLSLVRGNRFTEKTSGVLSSFADGACHAVCATVEDICYERSYGSVYVLTDIAIDGASCDFGALLEISFSGELSVGDTVTLEGVIDRPSDGYEYYHRSKGIVASITAEHMTRTGGKTAEPSVLVCIRQWIAENFETYIGEGAGYASALLIGDREGLDSQTVLAYQRLGISHVLAVSGMHFSVIVGGVDLLLRILTVPKKKKNLFLILFSVFFAAICGFSASIARAVIMFCLYYVADSLGEKSDPLTSLFFAATCIITVNPWTVYDAGLWLSVFSTLGIITVMPAMKGILEKKQEERIAVSLCKGALRGLLCMMLMNLTAIFFTMPIVYFLYGGISLISPLANMIFIPLTELILYLLVLLTIVGFAPIAASFLGAICGSLISFADDLARSLSDIRGIYVSIRYPFAFVILIALILGVLTVLFAKEFRLRRLLSVFLVATLAFGGCFFVYRDMGKDSSYLYLNTDGKNDVVTLVDDGEVMIVDATNGGRRVPFAAVDALSEYYRCEIDTYVLTHLHSYHAETLRALADTIKVHRILIPAAETEKDVAYANAIVEAVGQAAEIVFYKRDGLETVRTGDTILHLPGYEGISRSTHPTLVFSAETAGVGAWIYCGSSSMELSEHWADAARYRVVIMGAHGPTVKNIFDDDCLSLAELVLFTSSDTMALVDMDKVNGKTALVEETYHIRFEHG